MSELKERLVHSQDELEALWKASLARLQTLEKTETHGAEHAIRVVMEMVDAETRTQLWVTALVVPELSTRPDWAWGFAVQQALAYLRTNSVPGALYGKAIQEQQRLTAAAWLRENRDYINPVDLLEGL
jgi:hypothetical protein